ncbi:MAG: putative Acetylornithine deacetylase [Candidatus Taylorbacteria bacterium]|nr:putative Acetylornithine deacetylase [Candidatus Taylorbacteria bacterium]
MKNKIIILLEDLVNIESFVDSRCNEIKLSQFISDWFLTNIPTLEKYEIEVEGDRKNMLFISPETKILFCCHMDTVLLSKGQATGLTISQDKLFGLGSKDMKGGMAAALLAVSSLDAEDISKAGFLFYCDEEYSQKGMETMMNNFADIPKNLLCLISPESSFKISFGCKGYISFDVEVEGESAHSARPLLGIHAGEKLFALYEEMKKEFTFSNELGVETLTMVGSEIGTMINGVVLPMYNKVPDFALGNFSLRIPYKYSTKDFEDKIYSLAEKNNIKIKSMIVKIIRHPGSVKDVAIIDKFIILAKEVGFLIEKNNPNLSGYNDVAMLSSIIDVPFFNFGPYGEHNHTKNEYVSLSSIEDTIEIFSNFIKKI